MLDGTDVWKRMRERTLRLSAPESSRAKITNRPEEKDSREIAEPAENRENGEPLNFPTNKI